MTGILNDHDFTETDKLRAIAKIGLPLNFITFN